MRRNRCNSALAALLCLPLGAAADSLPPDNVSPDERAMADAFYGLLMSGDLADIDAVSKRLGVQLSRRRLSWDSGADKERIYAISSTVPHFLLPGLAYEAFSYAQGTHTRIDLNFQARVCPDLNRWARDWGLQLRSEMLTDGAGGVQYIMGPDGITILSVGQSSGSMCGGSFHQVRPTVVSFPPAAGGPRNSGNELVRKVAGLVAAGDLRDYRRVGGVLHVDFIPIGTLRQGLLYEGDAVLGEPLAGIDASLSSYSVADSGWVEPPGFVWRPRQLAPRTASISLSIDTEHVCIPVTRLQEELRRRAIDFQISDQHGTAVLHAMQSGNQFEISASRFGRCVESFNINQITDFVRSVQSPLGFFPDTALTAGGDALSAAAIGTLDEVMRRLRKVALRQIDIAACYSPLAVDAEKESASRVAQLVRSAFLAHGVRAKHLRIQGGRGSPSQGPCFDFGQNNGLGQNSDAHAYVAVEVLAN